jgi:predicted protein tyrosine phosphatase
MAKVVTMCQGGQVRSVGMKFLLSYKYGHDVIPCGWESNTLETREMLFKWADYIVIMQSNMEKYVPECYHNDGDRRKLYCFDVGEDRFGSAFHPELQKMLDSMIVKHGLFNR